MLDNKPNQNGDSTEAALKAELHFARLQLEAAEQQFAEAKEMYRDIGLGNADGNLAVLRANQTYVNAMAAYRDALDRWSKFLHGRKS